jgi:hypothetical protein
MILLCERQTNPVVQWSCYDFPYESQDEGGYADETSLRNGEVVWWECEDRSIDDTEDDDPLYKYLVSIQTFIFVEVSRMSGFEYVSSGK